MPKPIRTVLVAGAAAAVLAGCSTHDGRSRRVIDTSHYAPVEGTASDIFPDPVGHVNPSMRQRLGSLDVKLPPPTDTINGAVRTRQQLAPSLNLPRATTPPPTKQVTPLAPSSAPVAPHPDSHAAQLPVRRSYPVRPTAPMAVAPTSAAQTAAPEAAVPTVEIVPAARGTTQLRREPAAQ
jgi:hypothetical protein